MDSVTRKSPVLIDFIRSGASRMKNSSCPTYANASPAPTRKNCGTSQNALIMPPPPPSLAASRRFFSTSAEVAMATVARTRPAPTRWSEVRPWGRRVRRRAAGTRTRSLREVKRRMERKRKTEREPAGMANPPGAAPGRRWRSMRVACSTEKVVIWEYTVQKRMQVDQMGSSFTTIFTSSTSVTVAAGAADVWFVFAGDAARSASMMAALSRHLHGKNPVSNVCTDPSNLGCVVAVELAGVGGERQAALPPRRCQHPPDHGERAPLGAAVPVLGRAGDEDGDGEDHGDGGDAVAPAPADVVLDVHQHGDREEGAEADAEVEAVEEEHHGALLPRVAAVELVGAEPGHVRLEPPRARRDRVQRRVQHRQLPPARRLAPQVRPGAARVRARRRPHPRHHRVHQRTVAAMVAEMAMVR
ncbi:Os02g0580966 [Oryza sativa Japonica Group]|uniref:Os02g0580966 protein n=1 Tax=Oryza sativa subsp. japonica TaxID=39947 RepID=A0A0P0VKU8_ORYSJ|nr:hypothetical protein EE612_012017 [Oryza sativa]BAS79421.1 Os02g0580966 [Oryza sativa Japonica Group]